MQFITLMVIKGTKRSHISAVTGHDSWEPESELRRRCADLLREWQPLQVPRVPTPRQKLGPKPTVQTQPEKCLYANESGIWETCTLLGGRQLRELADPEELIDIRLTTAAYETTVARKLLQPWVKGDVGQHHGAGNQHPIQGNGRVILGAEYALRRWTYRVQERTSRGTRDRNKLGSLFSPEELASEPFARAREHFIEKQPLATRQTIAALILIG